MKCPHCHEHIVPKVRSFIIGNKKGLIWELVCYECPNERCNQFFLELVVYQEGLPPFPKIVHKRIMIYPKELKHDIARPEVPKEIADDFNEAVMTLNDSPKASAALSRRCLQNLLREKAKVKPGKLYDEIQELLDRKELPSYLAKDLDYVRIIGNFAAHPEKSEKSDEIIQVEPGEAEWILDILEGLFDFYYVQPEIMKKKRENLNKKLEEAGKPKPK